jgi:hypothetical protein
LVAFLWSDGASTQEVTYFRSIRPDPFSSPPAS